MPTPRALDPALHDASFEAFIKATRGVGAWRVAKALNRVTSGIDWRGCSKTHMANEYANECVLAARGQRTWCAGLAKMDLEAFRRSLPVKMLERPASPEERLQAALRHLHAVLNGARTHDEQQAADTAAREWLASIGSEPGRPFVG
jgi:hypothetical protein